MQARFPTWFGSCVIAAAALGGCATSAAPTDAGAESPVSGQWQAQVGPAGGQVSGGGATVRIPAGALTSFVDVRMATVEVLPALPAGLVTAGTAFALTPHGTHFALPVSVELPATADATAVLRLDDPSDTSWDTLEVASIDEFHQARVAVDGFSVYVAARPDDEFYIPIDAATDASTVDGDAADASELDAQVTDAGLEVDANAPDVCGALSAADLFVEAVGSGAVSGCAPRTCQGLAFAPNENPSTLELLDSQLGAYVGCTVIVGDLVVNQIMQTSLPELACLEHVTGRLVIWNSPGLTTLDGLQSLMAVDGDFGIGYFGAVAIGNNALTRIDALTNLRVVGGTLHIDGGYELNNLSGLERLRFVGGDFTVSFPHQARDLSGMNALEIVGGNLHLWRPEGLTTVSGLRALREIAGTLLLWGATDMLELSGFPNLECIGDTLDIGGDQAWEENMPLQRISAFASLKSVATIRIEDNPALRQIDTLSIATNVGGLYVNRNPQLVTMSIAPGTEASTKIEVTDNPMLSDCDVHELAARQAPEWQGSATITGNLACQ